MGDVATWFSGLFTAAVFGFTLYAWGYERQRAARIEQASKIEKELNEANKIACWIERSSIPLRQRTGVDEAFLPEGSWALVFENGASFALFTWSVHAHTTNPSLQVSIDSQDKGPIGPNGGLLVLPLAGISRDAVPSIAITVRFIDEAGMSWTRGAGGLVRDAT